MRCTESQLKATAVALPARCRMDLKGAQIMACVVPVETLNSSVWIGVDLWFLLAFGFGRCGGWTDGWPRFAVLALLPSPFKPISVLHLHPKRADLYAICILAILRIGCVAGEQQARSGSRSGFPE